MLDRAPVAGSEWSIRRIVYHTAIAQQGYVSLLTRGAEPKVERVDSLDDARALFASSGTKLREIATSTLEVDFDREIESSDGYTFDPWVVLVQAVNHTTDHRHQIRAML